VRECGVTLLGPNPKTLIDPISSRELLQAVRSRLSDWADWAQQPDDPDWLLPRSHKAYVVETMCRALYTLEHGELSSKSQAVEWAVEALPEPWRSTVERSQKWRTDDTYFHKPKSAPGCATCQRFRLPASRKNTLYAVKEFRRGYFRASLDIVSQARASQELIVALAWGSIILQPGASGAAQKP